MFKDSRSRYKFTYIKKYHDIIFVCIFTNIVSPENYKTASYQNVKCNLYFKNRSISRKQNQMKIICLDNLLLTLKLLVNMNKVKIYLVHVTTL